MHDFDNGEVATKEERVDFIQRAATCIAKSYPVQEEIKKLFGDAVNEIERKYIIGSHIKATLPEKDFFMEITKEINRTLVHHPEMLDRILDELKNEMISLRNGVHEDSKRAKCDATYIPKEYKLEETSSEDAPGQFHLFNRRINEFYIKINEVRELNKTAMISFYDGRLALNWLRRESERTFTNGQEIEARGAKKALMKAEAKMSNADESKSAYDAVIQGIKIMCDEIQKKVDKIITKFAPYYRRLLSKCLYPQFRYRARQYSGLFVNATIFHQEMLLLSRECHPQHLSLEQLQYDYQWVLEENVNKTKVLWS